MGKIMKNKNIFFLFGLTLIFIHTSCQNINIAISEDTKQMEFIKVQNQKLVTPDGKDFFIKSMAFGNTVWGNPSEEPKYHHTKESYEELKQLGFNAVRFYINYQLFEDDSNPYNYKNAGFDWLNKNIEWAKENNIFLIVNMHIPQGGFQSLGNGLALFTEEENQNRLIALWKKIADYYKDCSTIIGWGLVNEPIVPYIQNNAKTSLEQWNNLANKISKAIRTVDKNHVLFVERAIGVISNSPEKKYYSFNEKDAYPIIEDYNLVYELHSYDPIRYTHQQASWIPEYSEKIVYPDESKVMIEQTKYIKESTKQFKEFSSEWKQFSHEINSNDIDTSATNIFQISVKPGYLKQNGCLYIDDFILTEIDKNGNEKILKEHDFSTEPYWYFGTKDNKSTETATWERSDGHNADGCYVIKNTEDWAYLTAPENFLINKDCTYRLSIWIKSNNINADTCYASFGFDLNYAQVATNFTKEFLNQKIKSTIQVVKEFNKPVFIGEFGCIRHCFENNNGGVEYINDSIEIFKNLTAGFNYHTYHEWNFGLYYSDPTIETPNKEKINSELINCFKEFLPKI